MSSITSEVRKKEIDEKFSDAIDMFEDSMGFPKSSQTVIDKLPLKNEIIKLVQWAAQEGIIEQSEQNELEKQIFTYLQDKGVLSFFQTPGGKLLVNVAIPFLAKMKGVKLNEQ